MNNTTALGTWLYILLNVAYKPEDVVFEGKRITLNPGQGIFKMRQMAKVLGVSRSTLHRTIMRFKSETQIETQTTPRNTLITVVNWEKYQAVGTQNGTQMGHNRDTSGTQNENLPYYTNKEYKNIRNKEKIYKKEKPEKHQYGEYKNVLLSDEEIEKLKTEFPLDWQERIEKVSEYCASHGKAYKDYLATIRNWARKDKEKLNGTSSNTGQNMDRKSTGIESRAAEFEAIIRAAQERGQAGTVGEVQAGASVSGQDLRTSAEQGELPL